MIHKIIYLLQVPLTGREVSSFGVSFYHGQGIDVEVWECTPFLNPKIKETAPPNGFSTFRKFESKSELISALAVEAVRNVAIINLLPKNILTLPIFTALNNSPVHSVEVRTNAVPVGSGQFWTRLKKLSPSRLINFIIRRPEIWQPKAGIPSQIIYGGAVTKPKPNETKRIISAHALDYDTWLEFLTKQSLLPKQAKGNDFVQKSPKHIVFLDQNLPFHADFSIQRRQAPVTAKNYFPALCNFFNRLEETLNLPVVIAAHPRATYSQADYSGPDYFGGRPLIIAQTLPLIFDSALVLTHYSTAVNFAIMAQKPLLLLTSKELENTEGHIIHSMSEHLGVPVANIDHHATPLPTNLTEINQTAYSKYFHNYIKEADSPERPFWQILLDDLQNPA